MKELKALIFDVDGTLADTERDGHRVAFNRAFEEAGLSWHWDVETYGALLRVTGGKERIRLFIEEYQADFDTPDELGVFIRELHESKTRYFAALLQSGAIHLRPGVERLLKEARAAGLRLGIATTTTAQNVTVNAYTRQQSFTGAKIVLDQLGEPGSEFTVLSGDAGESTFVDVPFLKRVYAD
jgi:phosphoglycolate phosphatase-like HAD superfamily hydrolase